MPGEIDGVEGNSRELGVMYNLPRPYPQPSVKVPKVMYEVNPINPVAASESSSTAVSNGETLTLQGIEERQLRLLQRLRELKATVTKVQRGFESVTSDVKCAESENIVTNTSSSKSVFSRFSSNGVIDLVIHAHPNSPPYFILTFLRLLEQCYDDLEISLRNYVHSSYHAQVDNQLTSMFYRTSTKPPNLKVSVLWKNAEEPVLITNPMEACKVTKEENIARFFARIFPDNHPINYDFYDWSTLSKVDQFLAASSSSNIMCLVEQELKNSKNSYLFGGMTIADIVAYSAVASEVLHRRKKLPSSLVQWMKGIETLCDLNILTAVLK